MKNTIDTIYDRRSIRKYQDKDINPDLIEEVLRNKSGNTKMYAGLFVTFMNGSNSDLIKQIHVARKYCLNGLILFDYAHLSNNYVETLTESVFKPCKKELEIVESNDTADVAKAEKKQKKKKRAKGVNRGK